jgi:hypothetical protein
MYVYMYVYVKFVLRVSRDKAQMQHSSTTTKTPPPLPPHHTPVTTLRQNTAVHLEQLSRTNKVKL